MRPANLVHTDEGALIESTPSGLGYGSPEPGTSSSAGEQALHTRQVVGSIPTSSTIPSGPSSAIGRPGHDGLEWVETPRFIYFVLATESRRIKIGISGDPRRRFHNLQTASPEPLAMLGWIETVDAETFEAELHECWECLHVRGEWFSAHPDLMTFVMEQRDPLPEPEPDPFEPMRPRIPEGVFVPTGNTREDRMRRYCLARGLAR